MDISINLSTDIPSTSSVISNGTIPCSSNSASSKTPHTPNTSNGNFDRNAFNFGSCTKRSSQFNEGFARQQTLTDGTSQASCRKVEDQRFKKRDMKEAAKDLVGILINNQLIYSSNGS